MYTEEVNKIALSSNDKRIQTFDRITAYPIGMDQDLIDESEKNNKRKTYTTILLIKK